MTRITLAFVVVVLAVAIQAAPQTYDDIVQAAKAGNWEQFQALLTANFGNQPGWKPFDFDNIRDLKPLQGGKVYGEAEYTFQSSSDLDGKKTEESGGHKLINDNGKVDEFDFDPLKTKPALTH